MADPIVIYDPVKEIATFVDPDNHIGFGPAAIGPDAEKMLDAWLATVPYDVTAVDSAVLRDWFEPFAGRFLHDAEKAGGQADPGAVVPPGDAGVAEAALAEHEAAASGAEPPAPAPADADMEANPGEAPAVASPTTAEATPSPEAAAPPQPLTGPCPACNATGNVPGAEPGSLTPCNLCQGTGQLPTQAPA
jgi:hypothetical protein